MPASGFEPSLPEAPRSGQYLPVKGFTSQEGGGDVEVRLTQCPDCLAAVAENVLDAHKAKHEALAAGGGPGGPSDPKAAKR